MDREPINPKDIPGNAINEDVRNLIHMMMKIRKLEIDLLGTYLRKGNYREAEEAVLGSRPRAMTMAAPAGDVDGGQGRCPTGFREENGRCVPE